MKPIIHHNDALAHIMAKGELIEQAIQNSNLCFDLVTVTREELLPIVQGALLLAALAVKTMPDDDIQAFRMRILNRVIETHKPKDGKHESIT